MKPNNELKEKLNKEVKELINSLNNGTFKVDSSELSNMKASFSWLKNNKQLIKKLDEIAVKSGLINKK